MAALLFMANWQPLSTAHLMPTWHLLPSLAVLALVSYLTWHFVKYGNPWAPRPGTLGVYPFVGAFPSLAMHQSDLWDYLTGVFEQSPSLSFFVVFPGVNWFWTANPQHIQHILKDNFSNYVKGDDILYVLSDLLGHGILTTNGEQWKQQRKMAGYEFSAQSLRDWMLVSFHEEIKDRLIPTLDSAVKRHCAVNMQDVLLRFTFDGICRIAFDTDPATLTPDLRDVPLAAAFDRSTVRALNRALTPHFIWKFLRYFSLGPEKVFARDMKMINEYLQGIIDKRRREIAGEGGSPQERVDLLSRMFALEQQDGGKLFTDTFLRDSCINFLMAGRDTTAVSLSWLLWQLTLHPRVEQKIVDELQAILNSRKGDTDSPFTFEELKKLNYTHAAINESLRLFSTVPTSERVAINDDTFPDGTFVGKGWRVSYTLFAVGRMTRIWGPDAMEFKPERWILEDGGIKNEPLSKFIVFNLGPRTCLGREMAYLQMKCVISSLLTRYKLRLVPGQRVRYQMSVTILMKEGLHMNLEKRQREP